MVLKNDNCYIGFSDRLLMLIGIPVLSFLVPIIFFNCRFNRPPFITWPKYGVVVLITTIIWFGCRFLMVYYRKKYPKFDDVKKRLWVQSAVIFVFTVTTNILMGRVFQDVFRDEAINKTAMDIFIYSNMAVLFCTLTVVAIYESVFFMHQLRHSVEETENLKRESLNAQLDTLRTQVNPHFLFNNLNTLVSLIPESPKHAVEFVQQLSKVYRHILEVKDAKSILLKEELEVLQAYSFLLKTRFGNNLSVNINIPPEKINLKIVPLSLQLLMENAIKHNIVSSTKPLQINIFSDNGSLVFDNNLQIKNQITESTGIGLNNIRNRYKLLGNEQVKVTETDTNFTVSIPLIEN